VRAILGRIAAPRQQQRRSTVDILRHPPEAFAAPPDHAEGYAVTRRRAGSVLALVLFLLPSCAATPPPRPLPPAPQPVAAVNTDWPRPEVLALASAAYSCAAREGKFSRPYLTVIDYSLPSTERRLWVIDVRHNRVLHHELVAHGEGSGGAMAVAFSNQMGSHQSSLGLFRTDETYTGRFGYSLRLSGLEPAINDRARQRAIVLHGSSDVSDAFAARWGMIGRSWGCPAVPVEVASEIIDTIAGGSALFAYYPDQNWLRQSRYLHCPSSPDNTYTLTLATQRVERAPAPGL